MKIATIVGARPQFIKAAAVSRAIAAYNRPASDAPVPAPPSSSPFTPGSVSLTPATSQVAPDTHLTPATSPVAPDSACLTSAASPLTPGSACLPPSSSPLTPGSVSLKPAASRPSPEAGPLTEVLIHTGQHYDDGMSAVFFRELEIPEPQYNLGVGSGTHGRQTGQMLAAIEEVLLAEKPAWVLIYGDTNSTLAGALAAAKLHIPVAHVEAGLRSFNRRMPEEINRVVADRLSTLLLCPSQVAADNLAAEGIVKNVVITGDVMADALQFAAAKAATRSDILARLGLQPRRYLLATVHRAENTDDPDRLESIMKALIALAKEETVVLPLHPRTRKILAASLPATLMYSAAPLTSNAAPLTSSAASLMYSAAPLTSNNASSLPSAAPSAATPPALSSAPSPALSPAPSPALPAATSHAPPAATPAAPPAAALRIIDPIGYFDSIALQKSARLLLTDSGGMQKEAYWLRVPCVTLRDETEWVETVASGWNILAGADHDKIMEAVRGFKAPSVHPSLYGEGKAAEKIIGAMFGEGIWS